MIGKLNTLRSCMSDDWRRSKLGIPLRIHQSHIYHLTKILTKLTLIWSIGCPRMHKWRRNSSRCPDVRRKYLNTLIQILNSRLSSSRRKAEVEAMTSVFIFVVIMSLNDR